MEQKQLEDEIAFMEAIQPLFVEFIQYCREQGIKATPKEFARYINDK